MTASFLTGYCDRPSAAPSESIGFHISTDGPDFEAAIVRLAHGSPKEGGPGLVEREISNGDLGRFAGSDQVSDIGSYAVAPDHPAFEALDWTVRLFAKPTLFREGEEKTLFAKGDFRLGIDGHGLPLLYVRGDLVCTGTRLRPREWFGLAVSFSSIAKTIALHQRALKPLPGDEEVSSSAPCGEAFLAGGAFYLAAHPLRHRPAGRFNGKIDRPLVLSRNIEPRDLDPRADPGPAIIARWDLGHDPAGRIMRDRGPHGLHGAYLQQPARAVTGCTWSAEETDWRNRPEEYSAAHFHDDDVEDIGWKETVRWTLPADMRSGVYALRLRSGDVEDHIPFFVCPRRGTSTAPVLLVLPTYSYLAYANERLSHELDFNAAGLTDRQIEYDEHDRFLMERSDFGVSMYDHHRDGSGVIFASWRRPLLNLRPKYNWWLSGGPQYLSLDLCIVHWLESIDQQFDVVTDHELDDEGVELLARYRAVLTSSHPEYCSKAMVDALQDYIEGGGRLLYMGGNGFYWVTTRVPDRPWLIEIRRGFSGNRAWESEAGEEHHASTGERGGLWRRRGRSPNALVGVGFSAQGWDTAGRPYRLTEAARDPRAAWIFEGVEDEVIGDFGLAMNSAAGDELDRADAANGTPAHALVLASSGGHGRYYLLCQEDALFSHRMMGGEVNQNVRADLCFFETRANGAVFSVGSKAWAASLSHNDYRNNVARITGNVLRGFLSRDFATVEDVR